MGLWDRVKGAWDGFFGNGGSSRSSSTTTTTYEPDKVRVAEIEASVKVRLAGMEQDRIRLYTDTQLELAEFNAKMEAAVIEARARGEQAIQQSMLEMMREANILAEQRLKLIETAGLDVIKQIDGYYDQLISEIDKDDFTSTQQKIPKLLEILKQFKQGTPEHTIYFSEVQDYRKRHNDFITERMKSLHARQAQVLASCIAGKEQIGAHINLLVEKRMEQIGMSLQARQQAALTHGLEKPQIEQQLQIADEKADSVA